MSHSLKFGLNFSNGDSTSSSLQKFIKATLPLSPISCESSKAQDSKTNSLKNKKFKGKVSKD